MQLPRAALFATALALCSALACKDDPAPASDGKEADDPPTARDSSAPEAPEAADPALEVAVADAVDPARYRADVEWIAAPRVPGSEHWKAVQDRCASVFEASGFTVERHAAGPADNGTAGVNVIGRKPGSDPDAPAVVVGAHYDHIEGCAGADDNASGTAAVLELARVLGPDRQWPSELVLACWDIEEEGLHGSAQWVTDAVEAGEEIGVYFNFDAMGYASDEPDSQRLPPEVETSMAVMFEDQLETVRANDNRANFVVVLADSAARDHVERVLAHAERVELVAIDLQIPKALIGQPALSDLRRSDHASFWLEGIPAVFMSDTAEFRTDTYHCRGRPDTADTLDYTFATKVVRASASALVGALAG